MSVETAFLDGAVPPTDEAARKRLGRPNGYDEELGRYFCDRVAGGATLEELQQDPKFPGRTTFFRWLRREPLFQVEWAAALQWRAHGFADQIIAIADDASEDYLLKDDVDGGVPAMLLNREAIARSKIRIGARQWLMSKMLPKRYGKDPEDVLAPPADNGDGAKVIDGERVDDPLRQSLHQWKERTAPGAAPQPRPAA